MKKENEELEKEMLAQFNVQELEERLEMKKSWKVRRGINKPGEFSGIEYS